MKKHATWLLFAVGVLLMSNARAWACAVCQGDPDSELVKGAEAGVILLRLFFVRHRRFTFSHIPASRSCSNSFLSSSLSFSGSTGCTRA